jgi:hypothetical protein
MLKKSILFHFYFNFRKATREKNNSFCVNQLGDCLLFYQNLGTETEIVI